MAIRYIIYFHFLNYQYIKTTAFHIILFYTCSDEIVFNTFILMLEIFMFLYCILIFLDCIFFTKFDCIVLSLDSTKYLLHINKNFAAIKYALISCRVIFIVAMKKNIKPQFRT